jgi:hypothetical protein
MRQRLFAAVALALVAAGTVVPAAGAHHGDTGEYDITKPLFVRGEVLEASYGFPHATLRVRVDRNLRVPADLARYKPLTRLSHAPSLDDLRVPRRDELDVLLHPSITAETADPASGRPEVGDTMEGVFVPRCPQGGRYYGEIRAVAFALGATSVSLRSDPDPTGYSEGCNGDRAGLEEAQPAEGADSSDQPAAAAEDDGFPVLWIAFAVIAVLVAVVAIGPALRRRLER